MKKILDFLSKYALVINIALFFLSFALFFLPLNATPKKFVELGVNSYNPIMYIVQNGIEIPEYCLDYCVVYLLFFLILWILQIVSIILSKKKPFLNVFGIVPFTGIIIYTIYLFADNNLIPHIGFFIMLVLFCFYLFELIVYLLSRQQLIQPREHKPTDKERIAELEQQVAELQKERDVD